MGRLLDRGDLFTIQCGVNAMIVVGMGTMPTNEVGAGPSRVLDALVGAGVALLLSVLLPGDLLHSYQTAAALRKPCRRAQH